MVWVVCFERGIPYQIVARHEHSLLSKSKPINYTNSPQDQLEPASGRVDFAAT